MNTTPSICRNIDIRALPTPVPCKGRLRLWEMPADVEAAVRAQLREVA